jgi:peroxiredoxin Q/BCP
MLKIGSKAPRVTLPDADMAMIDLDDYRGRNVILFFYPKDDTPGCTREATDFSDHEDEFLRANCVIFGISRDDCLSHAAFRDKHGIAIGLLADCEAEVCRRYGVLQEKEVDGIRKTCLIRSTFVIDGAGVIRQIYEAVTPKGHAAEVLRFVRGLDS